MSAPPGQPRVIVYVFASPFLQFGEAEQGLRADMLALCAKEDLHLVDVVIDYGPPKRRPEEYPALARVAQGEADGVLVTRSCFVPQVRVIDRLERLCAGESTWLPRDVLAEAGMLPRQTRDAPRRRPGVKRRAVILRASGLGLAQIGHVLMAEGYRAPSGIPWSARSIAKLLGVSVLAGGLGDDPGDVLPRQ